MCSQCRSCHIVRGFIECHRSCCLTDYIQAIGSRHVCIHRFLLSSLANTTFLFFSSLIPTVFVPLSLLSYASLLGIASTTLLLVAIFIDGLSKFDAPGSLWSPAKTSFGPCSTGELGLAYGLFMAGVRSLTVFRNVIHRPNTDTLSSGPILPSLH